jgi:hypothetical protein
MSETDPNGIDQHAGGAKLDSGKLRYGLVLKGFARAIEAVVAVGTYGAVKYSDNGWTQVDDAVNRYEDAGLRHKFAEWLGELDDRDTDLAHAAHEAWNSLAVLQKKLEERHADS